MVDGRNKLAPNIVGYAFVGEESGHCNAILLVQTTGAAATLGPPIHNHALRATGGASHKHGPRASPGRLLHLQALQDGTAAAHFNELDIRARGDSNVRALARDDGRQVIVRCAAGRHGDREI